MAKIAMTKEQLNDAVKDNFGVLAAEIRAENDARGRELLAKQSDWAKAIAAMGQGPGPKQTDPSRKGCDVAMFALACAATAKRGDAAKWATGKWGADHAVTRALGATDFGSGGAFIPDAMSAEIIEFLRPMSSFRSLNPTLAPMESGKLSIAKITGGADAAYIGEGQDIPVTEQETGDVDMVARKCVAMLPITNELMRRASPASIEMLRNDGAAAIAQAGDTKFWRGDGTQQTPKGLRYQANPANVILCNTANTLPSVMANSAAMRQSLEGNFVRMLRPGWGFSSQVKIFLEQLLNSLGIPAFAPEMVMGTWLGMPYKVANVIPNNLIDPDNGSNTTEVYLADFADVVIGETTSLLVETSTEASYMVQGSLQSAFSRDETLVRFIIENDLAVRHNFSISVLRGVTWNFA